MRMSEQRDPVREWLEEHRAELPPENLPLLPRANLTPEAAVEIQAREAKGRRGIRPRPCRRTLPRTRTPKHDAERARSLVELCALRAAHEEEQRRLRPQRPPTDAKRLEAEGWTVAGWTRATARERAKRVRCAEAADRALERFLRVSGRRDLSARQVRVLRELTKHGPEGRRPTDPKAAQALGLRKAEVYRTRQTLESRAREHAEAMRQTGEWESVAFMRPTGMVLAFPRCQAPGCNRVIPADRLRRHASSCTDACGSRARVATLRAKGRTL